LKGSTGVETVEFDAMGPKSADRGMEFAEKGEAVALGAPIGIAIPADNPICVSGTSTLSDRMK
jgi:hypothetical protein